MALVSPWASLRAICPLSSQQPAWMLTTSIGMGIKAVSTTILVSETAIGFWRGSAILAWQLWYISSPCPLTCTG